MLRCVMEKLSLGELAHVQGVSQKFPIWVVKPKLGNSELWSRGEGWAPALKAFNVVQGKALEKISYLAFIRP